MDSIKLVGAMDAFQSFSNLTFIVPTNEAVTRFIATHPDITADSLRNVLLTHIIPGRYFSQDLMTHRNFRVLTKSGELVQFSNYPGWGIMISDAVITTLDILTKSGVLHVIDKVLTPEELKMAEDIVEDDTSTSDEVGKARRGSKQKMVRRKARRFVRTINYPNCQRNSECQGCTQGANCGWCGATNSCLNAANQNSAIMTCQASGDTLLSETAECP